MGSFWGAVDKPNLERVGPYAEAVAGTDGEDTDVNALVTAGNNRIILGPGSILTANLALTSASGGQVPRSPSGRSSTASLWRRLMGSSLV